MPVEWLLEEKERVRKLRDFLNSQLNCIQVALPLCFCGSPATANDTHCLEHDEAHKHYRFLEFQHETDLPTLTAASIRAGSPDQKAGYCHVPRCKTPVATDHWSGNYYLAFCDEHQDASWVSSLPPVYSYGYNKRRGEKGRGERIFHLLPTISSANLTP